MSTARAGTAGATRVCPHCKATILESAAVCPSCKHHVRFEATDQRAQDKSSALRVEGQIKHPPDGDPWEYSVVLTICNDRGEEIARQVVGVGALRGGEQRTFTLDVEMFAPKGGKMPVGSRH